MPPPLVICATCPSPNVTVAFEIVPSVSFPATENVTAYGAFPVAARSRVSAVQAGAVLPLPPVLVVEVGATVGVRVGVAVGLPPPPVPVPVGLGVGVLVSVGVGVLVRVGATGCVGVAV